MWGRFSSPETRKHAVILAFDLVMFYCVDQSQPAVFQRTYAMAERKYTTSDCPDPDTSQRERRVGLKPEPDSITNVCIFSTGNHSKSLWSDQEQKNTFLLTEHRWIQAVSFYDCVINYFGYKTGSYKHGATRDTCSTGAEQNIWLHCLNKCLDTIYVQSKHTTVGSPFYDVVYYDLLYVHNYCLSI